MPDLRFVTAVERRLFCWCLSTQGELDCESNWCLPFSMILFPRDRTSLVVESCAHGLGLGGVSCDYSAIDAIAQVGNGSTYSRYNRGCQICGWLQKIKPQNYSIGRERLPNDQLFCIELFCCYLLGSLLNRIEPNRTESINWRYQSFWGRCSVGVFGHHWAKIMHALFSRQRWCDSTQVESKTRRNETEQNVQ